MSDAPKSAVDWVTAALAAEGFTPLNPEEARGFTATGYTVQDSGVVGAARVVATARYTGQDKYDHWGEADRLANRLMDALERHGASFEEIRGHEPDSVFNAYPPTSQ